EQRIAVRRRARRLGGAQSATRAGAILDDDLLAPDLGELLAEQAGRDIGRAAGRERNNEANRPLRPVLRGSVQRDERERQECDQLACHFEPPPRLDMRKPGQYTRDCTDAASRMIPTPAPGAGVSWGG